MMGAGLNARQSSLPYVQDAAKVFDVIAGTTKDELTAFSAGRMPLQPTPASPRAGGSTAAPRRDPRYEQKLFQADEESIDIVERALGDLRTLGATVVDPGAEGAFRAA